MGIKGFRKIRDILAEKNGIREHMILNLVKNIHTLFFLLSICVLQSDLYALASDSSALSKLLSQEEKIWLENHPGLKVGGPKSFLPFSFFDEDGVAKGISYEYLVLIMGQFGVKLEFEQSLPWAEVLSKAKAKEIDIISCIAKSPEREAYLLFSDPYLSFPLVIITKKESKFIGGLDDLRGFKVAMVKKNVAYELLNRDKIELVYHFVDSTLDALRAVSVGDADAYIDNLASATYLIEKYGLTNLKVAAPTAYDNYNLHFAVRLDYPQLASIINKGLRVLTQGQHAEIRNKWLSIRYEYGIRKADVVKWVLMVVGCSLVVIAVIIVWNRRLNLEISERKHMEEALRESEKKYLTLFQMESDALFMIDALSGKIIDVNPAAVILYGYSVDELLGMKHVDLSAEPEKTMEATVIASSGGVIKSPVRYHRKKDGTVFPVEINSTSFMWNNRQTLLPAIRDITERKVAEKAMEEYNRKLEALSVTDGLTGIANRRHFDAVLDKEYARHARSGEKLSLIFLDIDYFKAFNDNYGHVKGDECLQKVAKVISECSARPTDLAARYGGEEFACILPETDSNGAVGVAENIRLGIIALDIPHKGSKVAECVTVSLGVITIKYNKHLSVVEIVKQVDQMLYLAKSGGRNRIEFIDTHSITLPSEKNFTDAFVQLV
ncbi:MAG: diguanylate cyclase [Desulfamplus sp.]|nr:diguanylate cyclase [Desulfamplus sp.]